MCASPGAPATRLPSRGGAARAAICELGSADSAIVVLRSNFGIHPNCIDLDHGGGAMPASSGAGELRRVDWDGRESGAVDEDAGRSGH
jgi:hypothetical protein